MTTSHALPIRLRGRKELDANIRTACASLAAPEVSLAGVSYMDALAQHGLDLVAKHEHRAQVPWMRDYDAIVVRSTGRSHALAAMVLVGRTGRPRPATESSGILVAPEPALSPSLETAVTTADTLVDLFDKLQRRSYAWPGRERNLCDDELCFPRLALCQTILRSSDAEADAVRMLASFDGFTGLGRFAVPEPIRSRLAWFLAYESTMCRAPVVAERVKAWRSQLSAPANEAIAGLCRTDGGVSTVAVTLATRPTMLLNPPLDRDGSIEQGYLLLEVDAWLESVSSSGSRP